MNLGNNKKYVINNSEIEVESIKLGGNIKPTSSRLYFPKQNSLRTRFSFQFADTIQDKLACAQSRAHDIDFDRCHETCAQASIRCRPF